MKTKPYHAHIEVYDDDRTTKVVELELGRFDKIRPLEELRKNMQELNPQYSIVLNLRCDDFEHD